MSAYDINAVLDDNNVDGVDDDDGDDVDDDGGGDDDDDDEEGLYQTEGAYWRSEPGTEFTLLAIFVPQDTRPEPELQKKTKLTDLFK